MPSVQELYQNITTALFTKIETLFPKIVGAIIILIIGYILAYATYKFILYIFRRLKILEKLEKFSIATEEEKNQTKQKAHIIHKLQQKLKIDIIVAKSFSYYIFLIFFRFAFVALGIQEIELFLGEIIAYLPNVFIAIVVWFFGIRFADFVHDIVYHALSVTKQKTSKIIASGAKSILLFFTLMIVLGKIGVATNIIDTIFIGFITTLTIAGWLSFGLWGKEIAKEILEGFRK